jgi:hypothetical protein
MIAKLTEEQRQALQANPERPLRVEDEQTRRIYLVVAEDALPTLWQDYIDREVRKGLDAIDRGEVEEWDIESIKSEARRIINQPPTSTS